MEQWLLALQTAMDAADTGEGLPQQLEEMRSGSSANLMNINSDSNMQHYGGDYDGADSYNKRGNGGGGMNVTTALNAAAQRVVSMSTMAVSRGFRVDQVRQLVAYYYYYYCVAHMQLLPHYYSHCSLLSLVLLHYWCYCCCRLVRIVAGSEMLVLFQALCSNSAHIS
jgi:hypothetical protein